MTLYGAFNDLNRPRLGITVSRRVGNAVRRNRWKRLLREAFRVMQSDLPGLDLVCVVRGAEPPQLAELRESLLMLARRIAGRLEPSKRGGATGDVP